MKKKQGKKWRPKYYQLYWCLSVCLDVDRFRNHETGSNVAQFRAGNCFRTKKEAEAARKRVLRALKGEQ